MDAGAHDALCRLDDEFLAYPDGLTDLLFDYVRAHPRVFGSVEP